MKKLAVLFTVVFLLALASAGYAADLQAGWYANIRSVYIFTYSQYGEPALLGSGSFSVQPGLYGPFLVTNEPYNDYHSRSVSVPSSAVGVTPGICVELPLNTGLSQNGKIAYMSVDWQTSYDSSQIQLQLVQHNAQTGKNDVLWYQGESGALWHATTMAWDITASGLAFRVVAVPEPSALVTISLLLLGMTSEMRRRYVR